MSAANEQARAAGGKSTGASALQSATTMGTGAAVLSALVAGWNRWTMPRLVSSTTAVDEFVTICVPARNEADRLPDLLADLRSQVHLHRMTVLILDDDSDDDTHRAAMAAIDADTRFTLIRNTAAPRAGWTGKTAACVRLAEIAGLPAAAAVLAADTSNAKKTADISPAPENGDEASSPESHQGHVLVFVDADVRLAPDAVAAAVRELRHQGLALLSPWPKQEAISLAETLVQPLLCWSWATTLPMTVAARSIRPSTVVACGQFLVFDTAAYRTIGGHEHVAHSATEDLDIARKLRRHGYRTATVAAGALARTRMYRGASELDAGYGRWLWSAFGGSLAAGTAVAGLATLTYLLPPLTVLVGPARLRRIGVVGYGAAVIGRLLARGTEGGPTTTTDAAAALAHPLSVTAYLILWIRSRRAHRTGRNRWKGRHVFATGARNGAHS